MRGNWSLKEIRYLIQREIEVKATKVQSERDIGLKVVQSYQVNESERSLHEQRGHQMIRTGIT